MRIDSCSFTGSSAQWGGVVYVWKGVTVRVDDCSFTDNSAGWVELCVQIKVALWQ